MSNGCSPEAWSKDSSDPEKGVVIWKMSSGHLGVLSAKSTLRDERQTLSKRTI